MQFDDFLAEIEAEARAEGPQAVAEIEAFRAYFSDVRVVQLLHRLERVMSRPVIARWLITPIPALGSDTPIEPMAGGDIRSVERLLSGLEDPGAR